MILECVKLIGRPGFTKKIQTDSCTSNWTDMFSPQSLVCTVSDKGLSNSSAIKMSEKKIVATMALLQPYFQKAFSKFCIFKKLELLVLRLDCSLFLQVQRWKLDALHGVSFRVKHSQIDPRRSARQWRGERVQAQVVVPRRNRQRHGHQHPRPDRMLMKWEIRLRTKFGTFSYWASGMLGICRNYSRFCCFSRAEVIIFQKILVQHSWTPNPKS